MKNCIILLFILKARQHLKSVAHFYVLRLFKTTRDHSTSMFRLGFSQISFCAKSEIRNNL